MIFNKAMFSTILFCILLFVCLCANQRITTTLSDESLENRHDKNITNYDSYQSALNNWKSLKDVSAWIGQHFSYDRDRAIELSETNRKNNNIDIYSPSELFSKRKGICVDLARFGVETIRKILPQKSTKYLMIEFVPIKIDGEIIRKHWLAVHLDESDYYFFADSKRPSFISGPFKRVNDFISEYTKYRQREIVSFKELESYRKKRLKNKKRLPKNQ